MYSKIDISKYKNILFLGIGGIGMSAIARYFKWKGKQVAGYDKEVSSIVETLISLGIEVHFKDDINQIPKAFLNYKNTLVIYTPALPNHHKELNYFKNEGFVILKRAEILGLITKDSFCFAVAGTHGKTTTSAILGHLLKEGDIEATAFLGGIATNYKSNVIFGNEAVTVVEADEYDRSFLQLHPSLACITSTDADHLDIYGQADALEASFKTFAHLASHQVFVRYGLDIDGMTFGFDEQSDYQALNRRIENGVSVFDVKTPTTTIYNVAFGLPGKHNILNALAALAMANYYGVSLEVIKKGLASFKGIERRFNVKINTDKLILIDDYAHHPTEINAIYDTVTAWYPNKENIVVFQPHLYSRTRDFADDFAMSLAQFNQILLLDIYPARELPLEGITSQWLLEKIMKLNSRVKVVEKKQVLKQITSDKDMVVSMLGAGDIGVLVNEIVQNYA